MGEFVVIESWYVHTLIQYVGLKLSLPYRIH